MGGGGAVDTSITRFKRKLDLEEDYNHPLGHCDQPPSTVAWLSDLPDHVISLILCSLPLHEAVQTSILSKRWRHLWSFMPNLTLPEFASPDFITNALKLFKAPRLGRLCLDVLDVQGTFPTGQEIDSWLSLACSRHVEDLVLRLNFFNAIPRCSCSARIEHWFTHDHQAFAAFSNVKRLTLRFCMLGPTAFKRLTSLEYLALEKVVLDDNMILELTSSCPMLGDLELRECNSNVPLRMSITNPKTSKLSIYERTIGRHDTLPVLELRAPYLSTLVVVSEVGRLYELKAPSLATLKLAKFDIGMLIHEGVAVTKILSGLNITKLYLCSTVLLRFGSRCEREGRNLAHLMIKVKHLHLQALKFPQELPGLVYFLNYCDGIETLVLDLENMYAYEQLQLRYLNCATAVLKDKDQFVIKDKKKPVRLDDEGSWSSLRFILTCQMPDLKYIVINGFKRFLHKIVGKAYNSYDSGLNGCCHVVDKYEFKLLKLLLKYSLGLEEVTIRTKDVYSIEEADMTSMEMLEIRTDKCNNIYLDGEVDKMEIPQWEKMLLSLSRGSPRAKINVTYG